MRTNMVLLASLVLASTLVATPEKQIAPEVVVREPRVQVHPAIARANDGALIVWNEWREEEQRFVVMGTRTDSGANAVTLPFLIGENSMPWSEVEIASDGVNYLVSWLSADGNLTMRRVLREGAMPEPQQVVAPAWGTTSCSTWTGSRYVLAYAHYLSSSRWILNTEVHATEIDPDGSARATRVLSPAAAITDVVCASGRDASLFVWQVQGTLSGTLLSREDTTSSPFAIGTGVSESPAVASNGSNFVVGWFSTANVERRTVSLDGTVTAPFVPSIPAGPMFPYLGNNVALSANGDGYILAWGASDLFALPLGTDGGVVGPPTDLAPDRGLRERHPRLAGNLIVYQRETEVSPSPRWRGFARTLAETWPRRRAARP